MTETRDSLLRVLQARDGVVHARPDERQAAHEKFNQTAQDVQDAGVSPEFIGALRDEVNRAVNTRPS